MQPTQLALIYSVQKPALYLQAIYCMDFGRFSLHSHEFSKVIININKMS
jgi:hypothetical protein